MYTDIYYSVGEAIELKIESNKETNKLRVIPKKPIKNKIRKKDKIIFHDGEGESPF